MGQFISYAYLNIVGELIPIPLNTQDPFFSSRMSAI